ncbi:MAG: tetratricopeptide repeat protein [Succinivibrio sp.]|nr:tetratricopeptide repeat protein [Succinivibrio sp.]
MPEFQNEAAHVAYESAKRLFNLGESAESRNDASAALRHFRKSISIFPSAAAYLNLGIIYYKRLDYRRALEVFEEGLELDNLDEGADAEKLSFWMTASKQPLNENRYADEMAEYTIYELEQNPNNSSEEEALGKVATELIGDLFPQYLDSSDDHVLDVYERQYLMRELRDVEAFEDPHRYPLVRSLLCQAYPDDFIREFTFNPNPEFSRDKFYDLKAGLDAVFIRLKPKVMEKLRSMVLFIINKRLAERDYPEEFKTFQFQPEHFISDPDGNTCWITKEAVTYHGRK